MTFYQLAIRYLLQNKGKTILLFLVFLLIHTMILSMSTILRATSDATHLLQEQTKSHIILESGDNNDKLTNDIVNQIAGMEDVASMNRHASHAAFPVDFMPVTANTTKENEATLALEAYDELLFNSPFVNNYQLVSGELISSQSVNSVVINTILASQNNLQVGDNITLSNNSGDRTIVRIVGLFLAGHEQKQASDTASTHRIENQLFIDHHAYSQLYGQDGYREVVVYSRQPEVLQTLYDKLQNILPKNIHMTSSDTLFKQMETPLHQVTRMTQLILCLTLITGVIVISILLCMWRRSRTKETAILISLGFRKRSIFLQAFMESFMIFIGASFGAYLLCHTISEYVATWIIASSSADISLSIALNGTDFITLLGSGALTVFIAVSCAVLPVLKSKLRDTLSHMEG